MKRWWRRLGVLALALFCGVLACSQGTRDEVGTASQPLATCGGDYLDATAPGWPIKTYTHGVGVIIPTTVSVLSGSWSGKAQSFLYFTTATDTISCSYLQGDSGTSSQPFPFTQCSSGSGQPFGGPGTPLTVTAVQFYAFCASPGCSGSPTLRAYWNYIYPTSTNPCQQVVGCLDGVDGPVAMLQNVADGTACTSDMCHVASCQSGTCTQGASLPKDDGNPCTDDTCTANVGITHTFNQTTCPPPSGAASTDPTVPTSFANATSFLQTNQGAQTGAVIASRAAVIRGRVIARDVYPNPSVIANITVSILGHPELGATLTRSDGWFDLAVNGGETYTVQFACGQYCTVSPPYVTVHRQATTRWLDYTILPDVALVQKDAYAQPQVTADSGTWQVARGSVVTDTDGKRQATLLIPPSTHACTSPSCATPFAGPYTMRLTEATVGTMGNSFGPAAMPADLPPQSGYTYAVEMSIDEADMAGLTSVAFNNTLLFYLDNFINIPLAGDAGATIPSGSYSRAPDAGAWRTEQNGLAVDIIGFAVDAENNLAAKLSVDGSTEMNYSGATPQVTDGERETLATIYQAQYQDAGTISLWRMPTQHFTPWDFNYAESFPNDAIPPPAEKPIADTPPPDPTCHAGSIVECEGQVLGESIPVPGTPFSLHYRSETQSGYHPTLTIPVTDGRGLPGICQRV